MNLVRLEDGLEALIDHRGKTPKKLGSDFVESGVPVASAILVDGGRLRLDEARCVSHDVFEKWMPVKVKMGDVILTSEAPLGKLARVDSDAPLVLGQRLYGLRGRKGVLDSGFLYYALQTDRVKADLVGRSTGTTVTGIRQSALRDVRIPAPGIATQQAIAAVLGALDDKIAANTKLATTADDLARSEAIRLMRGSSVRVLLGDVAVLSYGKALPATRRVPGPYPVFGSGGIGGYHDSYLELGPGVILGRKGSVGEVYWSEGPFFPIDTTFYVVPKAQVPLSYLYYAIEQQRFGENSSDSAVPGLNRDDAYRTWIPEPDSASLDRYDELAVRLRRMVHQAKAESGSLATIRDALLPALMSGRLAVRDAEAVVESAIDGDAVESEVQASGTLW